MSRPSDFPFTSSILLLFKSDLQEQHNELTRAMDSTQKEIRALAGSGPSDVSTQEKSRVTVFGSSVWDSALAVIETVH